MSSAYRKYAVMCLLEICVRCVSSRFCMKSSAMSPDDGAPIASLVELRFSRCWKSSFVV